MSILLVCDKCGKTGKPVVGNSFRVTPVTVGDFHKGEFCGDCIGAIEALIAGFINEQKPETD